MFLSIIPAVPLARFSPRLIGAVLQFPGVFRVTNPILPVIRIPGSGVTIEYSHSKKVLTGAIIIEHWHLATTRQLEIPPTLPT